MFAKPRIRTGIRSRIRECTLATIVLIAAMGPCGRLYGQELAVGTTNADAILASRASQVASYIQASGNFTYVQCTGALGQSPGGVKSYLAQLFDNTSKVRISGAWTTRDRIISVAQATSGSHTVSGQQVPITPRSDCALSGTGSTADFGVQQIVFQVVSPGGQVLTRTVYKRWN